MVTLALMVLLALLAVGLLSLASVSLRSSTTAVAASEARANARLALSMALGELQKTMGPDQRVSANGAILGSGSGDTDPAHPRWMGVWDSWKAGEGEASQHRTVSGVTDEMHPSYSPNRIDHFRSWLVSLPPESAKSIATALETSFSGDDLPGAASTAVRLVGEGSTSTLGGDAEAEDFVDAALINTGSGRFGWWVGDESQKARLADDSYGTETPATDAEKLFRHQAPGSMGTATVAGLENLTDDKALAALPSILSLDLIDGAVGQPSRGFHDLTPFSYSVLADVREGGLKRDLSTLLARPIDPAESGEDFMLYQFNDKERVPIQDLAAYYQLYQDEPTRGGDLGNNGVQYSSNTLRRGIQISSPDYGGKPDREKFLRQYTSLYRSPVPIKFQFLLGLLAKPRDPGEIDATYPETHELSLTITLAITLWNPTNLPMVLDNDEGERLFQRMRWWYLPLAIEWEKNGWTHEASLQKIMGGNGNFAYELDVSRGNSLVLAPGQVKVLSLPYDLDNSLFFARWDYDNGETKRLIEGWDPYGLMRLSRAATTKNEPPHIKDFLLLFSEDDQIQLRVKPDGSPRQAMLIQFGQDSYHDVREIQLERSYYHYTLASRGGFDSDFNEGLMLRGFRGEEPFTADVPVSTVINGSANGESWPFLNFSLMAATETREGVNPNGVGGASGRKFASRPFLHSSPIRPSTIDTDSPEAFYNYGWNWWIESINSVFEAPVQVTEDNKGGYYGGGYGVGFGTTHVVQQEVPVVPPMSIGALSHAHLGGYSLADSIPPQPWSATLEPTPLATGRGGLFPHTLQAIGNSYAHPRLEPDAAYTKNHPRVFNAADGATSVVFADHSYLANKALWDEFFFSSLSARPEGAEIFGGDAGRSLEEIAREVFIDGEPLPNRRLIPYPAILPEEDLTDLLAGASDFRDGLADRIASQLMVEGGFNVNSTSVEAWKVFLSSLKGKPVTFLDKDSVGARSGPRLDQTTPEGVPVSGFNLPAAGLVDQGATQEPNDPAQWLGWRELSDTEIEELAEAIVKQVKFRGPFLSLSEFVNRRLDRSESDLSAKGALQAALDDPEVSINEAFRSGVRSFSAAEVSSVNPVFREAMEGPVAYGSAAYVDQADILRNFAAQLTPRGDTFVIRAYGDSVDASGEVRARAWCEAVVQRLPEYVDSRDAAHLPAAQLNSESNRIFGRKMTIVSFRWLSPSEV
ncbi:hypothetical protein [Haloferula sp. A504]|uniref:hypothetical protein n=1 Tax=Haloferula sp. A504 TaxID=3373601 RepID=UPI0031C9A1A9|nr:hypothetical protein [Verrucomicrobiaceae bacterium E54]